MLILMRNTGEEITIKVPGFEDIRLVFYRCDAGQVRVGIDAEDSIIIMRSELLERDREDTDPRARRKPRTPDRRRYRDEA